MKQLIIIWIGAVLSGCTTFGTITYEERLEIRQNMARLQAQQIQRQVIKYTNDKRH